MVQQDIPYPKLHVYDLLRLGQRFMDKYGDEWVRSDDSTVVRLRDGGVGKFFGGKGLKLIKVTHDEK